jgi:hypothetical protein
LCLDRHANFTPAHYLHAFQAPEAIYNRLLYRTLRSIKDFPPDFKLTRKPALIPFSAASATGTFTEVVSYLAESSTQKVPSGTCAVLTSFGRGLSDALPLCSLHHLLLFAPYLVNTEDPWRMMPRLRILAELAICEAAPLALDHLGLPTHAQTMRGLRGLDYEKGMRLLELDANAAAATQPEELLPAWGAGAALDVVNQVSSVVGCALTTVMPHWAAYHAGQAAASLSLTRIAGVFEQAVYCPAAAEPYAWQYLQHIDSGEKFRMDELFPD